MQVDIQVPDPSLMTTKIMHVLQHRTHAPTRKECHGPAINRVITYLSTQSTTQNHCCNLIMTGRARSHEDLRLPPPPLRLPSASPTHPVLVDGKVCRCWSRTGGVVVVDIQVPDPRSMTTKIVVRTRQHGENIFSVFRARAWGSWVRTLGDVEKHHRPANNNAFANSYAYLITPSWSSLIKP